MKITRCTLEHWQSLVDIFIEMEAYYHGPLEITPQEMGDYLREVIFKAGGGTSVYISEENGRITGFACVTVLFPAPRFSGQMFIKELFVSENYRGQGTGKALMKHLAAVARLEGCLRLDWLSDKNDAAVQRFYRSLGGEVLESVNYFRLEGEHLHLLAGTDD